MQLQVSTTTTVQPEPTVQACTQRFYQADGRCFSVFCGNEYSFKSVFATSPAPDVYNCADQCVAEENCVSVNFIRSTSTCQLLSQGSNRADNEDVDGAVVISQTCPS